MTSPASVFLAYTDSDKNLALELAKNLKLLETQGLLHLWHSGMLLPGDDRSAEAGRCLASADLILILLSPDALASEEMRALTATALDRSQAGHVHIARIVPILLRPCDLQGSPLARLQRLPANDPVSLWRSKDEAWLEVVVGIRGLLQHMAARPTQFFRAQLGAPGLSTSPWRNRAADLDDQPWESSNLLKHEESARPTFLDRVLKAWQLRQEARGGRICVSTRPAPAPFDSVAEVWSTSTIGAVHFHLLTALKGAVTRERIFEYHDRVHAPERAASPGVESVMVYGGDPPSNALRLEAREAGIGLLSFLEVQGLIDFRPYLAQQTDRLERDLIYPPALYVAQRIRYALGFDEKSSDDALRTIEDWLTTSEAGRFILILGEFGSGKTFLLHELARRMGGGGTSLVPLLVEMRALEKAQSLDALVSTHLFNHGVDRFDRAAFRYMLAEGRIVLLFDGFDELALRVSYDRAAEHFDTLLEAAAGSAKVVVTSRTQHFESQGQVKTMLAKRLETLPLHRVVHLLPFDTAQISRFLENKLGDPQEAGARMRLLDEVRDLLGLSANPRLLDFISTLPADDLRKARDREGSITAAGLYQLLLDRWLVGEYERAHPKGMEPGLTVADRWTAATHLALRMWERTEARVSASELPAEVAAALSDLLSRRIEPGIAAHQVGSGTLLTRDDAGRFGFIHQSVLEWLVARAASEALRGGSSAEMLGVRELSDLMTDFFIALAGPESAFGWARATLEDGAGQQAGTNALKLMKRLEETQIRIDLHGRDLRGQDLSGQSLRYADLRDADLSEARLVRADLTGALLSGARLVAANLREARLEAAHLEGADFDRANLMGADLRGSRIDQTTRFPMAKMVGARIDPGAMGGVDAFGAALPGALDARPMLAWGGSAIGAVAFSPDGRLIAAGGDDGTVRIWSAESGLELRSISEHRGTVLSVAFSPDGRTLASASDDRTVRLWDVLSGRRSRVLEGHQDLVLSVVFSPDGRSLASGSYDRTVRLWNTENGKSQGIIEGHQKGVLSVAFSPDGRTLASGSDDQTVRLWEVGSGKSRRVLEGHQDWVRSVAFSPDGRTLASGSDDQTVRLWEVGSGKSRRTFPGGEKGVLSVAFSPDGHTVASGSYDGKLRLWGADGRLGNWRILEGHQKGILSAAFSPDGRILASASDDQTVRLWEVESGKCRRILVGYQNWVRSVAFSPDSRTLASASDDRTVRLWEVESGKRRRILGGHEDLVLNVAFSPDGRTLASGSADRTTRLWEVESGKRRRVLAGHQKGVLSVAFSPDGRTLASGSDDKTVILWEVDTGEFVDVLEGHLNWVRSVAFSPDGRTLASGSDDKTVILWEVETGNFQRVLAGCEKGVLSVAFSPDGHTLASGSYDQTVRLWETKSGKSQGVLTGHEKGVLSVAFSPDGRTLASGSGDKTVRLWEVGSRKHTRVFEGHEDVVLSVAFSPDGRTLASGSANRTVRVWDVETGECLVSLVGTPEGWIAFTPDGRYQLTGDPAGNFWHTIGLCRFEPGELEPYLPLRVPDDVPLYTLPGNRHPATPTPEAP